MSSLFDPFGLLGPRKPERESGIDPLREWLEATTSWADPRWWVTQAAGRTAERAVLSLAGAVAERFTGRVLEVRAGERTVRGLLESVRVDAGPVLGSAVPGGGDQPIELRVTASAVEVEGLRVDALRLTACDVTLRPGIPASLTAGPIEIEARVADADAVAWAAPRVPSPWVLVAGDHGRVMIRWEERDLELVAEPVIRGRSLEVELRAVSWRGHRAPVPRWLRLTRRYGIPRLPDGVELVDWWRSGTAVTARLRLAQHTERLRLDRVRDAIARDEPTIDLSPAD